MDVPCSLQPSSEQVINEIRYFMVFSALKKLLEQGRITAEQCQQANTALAEKYGVSLYTIYSEKGEKP